MPRQYRSPNGSPIIGTADKVLATAQISGINDDGTPAYQGGTVVHWDTQEPRVSDLDGEILFVDEDGEEWTFDQLTPAEEN